MKRSLFLYLFLLSALLNVFTFVYYDRQSKDFQKRSDLKLKKANDSILGLYNKWVDAEYFSLERNQNAQDYLNVDVTQFTKSVSEQIMELNQNPNGNPLIPYDAVEGKKFLMNKVSLLNHRWVIGDFSNGEFWGEVLLKYFVEEDGKVTFQTIDSQLYSKQ